MGNLARKLLFITSLSLLIFPVLTFAQARATIDVSIPCISCKYATSASPVGIIANFYELAIAFSGVLALGMIIYAGILRVTNASNPGKVGASNEIIYNALLGIVLLFGSYILLNTINPQLTKLELPALTKIEVPVSATTDYVQYECTGETGVVYGSGNEGVRTVSCHQTQKECQDLCANKNSCNKVLSCIVSGVGECPIGSIPPITDPEALLMEGGRTVLWESSTEPAKSNLVRVKAEFNKLQSELSKVGASATANSVYRPIAYQKHFYDIKLVHDKISSLTPTERTKCSALESELRREESKHGICPVKYGTCTVSSPSATAVHTRGVGIDIRLNGIAYSAINAFMDARGIKLRWQNAPNDEVHFNLK